MKRILFSPVGGSDPVNAGYDGSWIHCCRYYRPDMTVIFLSADMDEKEVSYQIFSRTLDKLNETLGTSIELRMERRPELKSPHLFDPFYTEFEKILTDIHTEYPDAELYVNVSSGTTAMKSCLMVLKDVLLFPVHVIQVAAPPDLTDTVHGKRASVPTGDHYDVDCEWDNNLDNLDDAEKRACLLSSEQQSFRILRKQMEMLIDHNEFYAAYLLAKGEAKDFVSDNAIKSLEAASDRMALDLYASVTKLTEVGYTDEPYLKSLNKNSLFRACEMVLTMKNDLEQNDIRSCLCKMTPVLLIVADEFLKSKGCDLNRVRIPRRGEDYIDVDKFRILWPDLYEKCRTYFLSYPKYGYASNTLINIIQYIDTDDRKTVENLKTLREIEENARNLVAHELVKITHKQFVEMTGLKPEDIIRLLIETIGKISPQFLPKTYWNGYDKMKAFLKEQLHKM